MNIVLNGSPREVAAPATIASVVVIAGAEEGLGVAVALDGEVVPRSRWSTTEVREGARVEVLAARGGG